MLKQALFLKDRLELGHNYPARSCLESADYCLLVSFESCFELLLCLSVHFADFKSKLLALLKEYLFVHVFLSENIVGMSFFVNVWTVVVKAIATL